MVKILMLLFVFGAAVAVHDGFYHYRKHELSNWTFHYDQQVEQGQELYDWGNSVINDLQEALATIPDNPENDENRTFTEAMYNYLRILDSQACDILKDIENFKLKLIYCDAHAKNVLQPIGWPRDSILPGAYVLKRLADPIHYAAVRHVFHRDTCIQSFRSRIFAWLDQSFKILIEKPYLDPLFRPKIKPSGHISPFFESRSQLNRNIDHYIRRSQINRSDYQCYIREAYLGVEPWFRAENGCSRLENQLRNQSLIMVLINLTALHNTLLRHRGRLLNLMRADIPDAYPRKSSVKCSVVGLDTVSVGDSVHLYLVMGAMDPDMQPVKFKGDEFRYETTRYIYDIKPKGCIRSGKYSNAGYWGRNDYRIYPYR